MARRGAQGLAIVPLDRAGLQSLMHIRWLHQTCHRQETAVPRTETDTGTRDRDRDRGGDRDSIGMYWGALHTL